MQRHLARSVGKLGACAEASGEGEQQQRHISQFQKSLSMDVVSRRNPEGSCPEGRRPSMAAPARHSHLQPTGPPPLARSPPSARQPPPARHGHPHPTRLTAPPVCLPCLAQSPVRQGRPHARADRPAWPPGTVAVGPGAAAPPPARPLFAVPA